MTGVTGAEMALADLRRAAAGCTDCELYREGTQTVFGEGPAAARILFVGEQPGDREDREGHPFVGPAGHILDRALDRASIDRNRVYVTNAVKHFHNEPRGKKRIHRKPNLSHVRACEHWLRSELDVVRPEIVVALGATAVQALLPRDVRVTADRGRVLPSELGPPVLVTVHPSSILRTADEERAAAMRAFVRDLAVLTRPVGATDAPRRS
ncbi:MAG TPA: UdgX family uracil-DNA binding protein [Actinomycetota bacterium]|jgi:DNA polymerase|nr:UdgX family uracil-DNA binding protein [Actinomycetota bacterium]